MPLILNSTTIHTILTDPSHLPTFSHTLLTGLLTPSTSPHRTSTTTPHGTTTLFMPCTQRSTTSLKTVSLPLNSPPNATITLHSSHTGTLLAVLSGSEITAFRTALTSLLLVRARTQRGVRVRKVVIIGAGKQAEWVLRLLPWAAGCMAEELDVGIYTRSGSESVKARIKISGYRALERGELEREVKSAEALFCCTPSTEPVVPVEWVVEGEKRGRYVSLIGSYREDMVEVEPGLLVREGWSVCVDRKEACFVESGEVIKSGIAREQVEEVAEVVERVQREGELGVGDERWLGNVVFKCVGVAVMDLVVSEEIVRIAEETGVGEVIRNFE
ncbi:NAD(P)-binding protein [Ascodesmis nigricans]|uniref:NAD(P)-binding protein n=1 Tax=Ascodesmis nigricans TaxID=341454 RepID=A0A4S2MNY9_9PEZI|nr:NAD(P)-binding protein [Ascodesmis nigricans]